MGRNVGLMVFENKVPKEIFWPEMDEVRGEGKKLRNKKLQEAHFSPSIIRLIKMRGFGECGAYGGGERCRVNLRERDSWEDLDIYGRIILKWFSRRGLGPWARLIYLRIRTGIRLLFMMQKVSGFLKI